MSQYLSKEQRRFQVLRQREKAKAQCVQEMFGLAGTLKKVTGKEIDPRQAQILWNVAKTRQLKKKKGLL